MKAHYETWLAAAASAASEAGELVMQYYNSELRIQNKGGDPRDLVTNADLASDRMITESLLSTFPEHGILSEEAYTPGDALDDSIPTWVVDPIDGTSNFAHASPFFSICIGLVLEGRARVGIVHAPALGWTFSATEGGGALLNGLPLQVTERTRLAEAIVACDWSRHPVRRKLALSAWGDFGEKAHTIRSFGSAALGLAAVAAGWVDAYYNYSLSPWDTAAGELLIREAGGRVTSISGEPWNASTPDILASNGHLHSAAQRVLDLYLPPV